MAAEDVKMGGSAVTKQPAILLGYGPSKRNDSDAFVKFFNAQGKDSESAPKNSGEIGGYPKHADNEGGAQASAAKYEATDMPNPHGFPRSPGSLTRAFVRNETTKTERAPNSELQSLMDSIISDVRDTIFRNLKEKLDGTARDSTRIDLAIDAGGGP